MSSILFATQFGFRLLELHSKIDLRWILDLEKWRNHACRDTILIHIIHKTTITDGVVVRYYSQTIFISLAGLSRPIFYVYAYLIYIV